MNVSIIALILFLMVIGTIGVSHAQKISSNVDVLMQLELRNHDGKLISYIEGKKILKVNNNIELNKFIDSLTDKQIVTIDGKKFEITHFEKNNEIFNRSHSFAMYSFQVPVEGKLTQVMLINNDAYQALPGDYIKPKFTFFRQIA